MTAQVVFVHGIRTSATMWRSQQAHLDELGARAKEAGGVVYVLDDLH